MLAKELGTNSSTILDMMNVRGLKRTPEQITFINLNKSKPNKETLDKNKISKTKIEGGVRGQGKRKWHLTKWVREHNNFSLKQMLVYKNEEVKYKDLILINKSTYKVFVEKRKLRLTLKTKTKVNSPLRTNVIEKQKEEESQQKRFEEIKTTSPKNTSEAIDQLVQEDKVAIKIDSRTTVWVKKNKCRFVNGVWERIKPLNVEQLTSKVARKIKVDKLEDENNMNMRIKRNNVLEILK